MKKRNIFQNQSQEILTLFEMAKDRSKVMCIPMDYAKKDHMVMFCNGNGKILLLWTLALLISLVAIARIYDHLEN
ncbi:hypothetical protein DO021_09225 [Desulfobacter hydrogenophilus]|uniref:Uncharacterized protein n=1 Tax=Desulfobacter hydrogenophilus TaxID=2291 RepID=A0A328FC66_9BACT|nr:hypothetical protein [Desulfobacter hydrogenophilus]NDY74401.1 hypothetical protein [Desulfobacter hydrogenophilus]QBH14390.1 hypothetical protein EYB58_16565 [Desulfobacter hydrogenophilus]RAM02284.1 hypothetical protein DO021_09225 [Desulfobacter hydrogenophilus]